MNTKNQNPQEPFDQVDPDDLPDYREDPDLEDEVHGDMYAIGVRPEDLMPSEQEAYREWIKKNT